MYRHKQPPPTFQPSSNTSTSASPTMPTSATSSHPSFIIPFLLLLPFRLLSALLSPISDCDETFNYWEPTHFLIHSYAFQTWEYSPLYALRSYAYLHPYLLLLRLSTFLLHVLPTLPTSPKIASFYFLRLSLALFTTLAESALITAASYTFSPRISHIFLLLSLTSPGLFRAAIEFLPSSFAMVSLMLSFAFWMRRNYPPAIFCVALAALLGWIYAAILALPMALHILVSKGGVRMFFQFAALSASLILAFMTPVDTFYFNKLVIAPLNHVLYNVFPKEGAGSELFGVEPMRFYAINLILNCHIAAVLFALFPIVLLVCSVFRHWIRISVTELWRRVIYLSPAFLCIAVFASQPHKEERFLVPCYPFIALVGAVAFVDGMRLLGTALTSVCSVKLASLVKSLLYILMTVVCVTLGASRVIMQVKSFHAPLQVYHYLSHHELRDGRGPTNAAPQFESHERTINICVGKEWYRFPTSFFLPHRRFRLRFVRSGFTGLLPRPYKEGMSGTWVIPEEMNEFNREEPGQYFDWSTGEGCHYFVDLDVSHRASRLQSNSTFESPIAVHAQKVIMSVPFLDSDLSNPGFRAFYIPGFQRKLVWSKYQLIRNLDILPFER